MRTHEQVLEIIRLLELEYPLAECSLEYDKAYELLFAVPQGERIEGAIRIGSGGFRAGCDTEIRIMSGEKSGHMSAPPPDYRAIPRENWLDATATYWHSLGL